MSTGSLVQCQSAWADALYTSLIRMAQNSRFEVWHDTDGAGTLTQVLRLDRDSGYGANQTAIYVRVNVAGVYSNQRVAIGAVDSGGTGYRVLRVPN